MSVFAENEEIFLIAAFLILLIFHLYRKARRKRGFFWGLSFLVLLGLFSMENMGTKRNSLYIGPILFTSENPSPLFRIFMGGSKFFAIENRGRETLLTSVSALSDRVITEFKIREGEEYLKDFREGPKEKTLSLAIPAGKKVGIQTSQEVVLEPRNVHALQFGVHGYYAKGAELPPVRLK